MHPSIRETFHDEFVDAVAFVSRRTTQFSDLFYIASSKWLPLNFQGLAS